MFSSTSLILTARTGFEDKDRMQKYLKITQFSVHEALDKVSI